MPNRDPLRTHLEGLLGASLPDYHVFQRAVSSIALEPQDLLFDVGIVDRRFFFVVAGILSVGIVQGSGREWIRRFAGPGELVSGVPPLGHPVGGAAAALHAMPAQTRGQLILTQYRVRAITRVNVRAVDAAVFWGLAARHREWMALALMGALAASAAHEKRERELLTLTAEDRYRLLAAERPQLIGRVPQKDLARYIGVTPVAMSRIVTRIRLGQRTATDAAEAAFDSTDTDASGRSIDAG